MVDDFTSLYSSGDFGRFATAAGAATSTTAGFGVSARGIRRRGCSVAAAGSGCCIGLAFAFDLGSGFAFALALDFWF